MECRVNPATSELGPGRNLVSHVLWLSLFLIPVGIRVSLKAKAPVGVSCLFSGAGWDLLLSFDCR